MATYFARGGAGENISHADKRAALAGLLGLIWGFAFFLPLSQWANIYAGLAPWAVLVGMIVTAILLGMRHATDADHIVAVSTIVARERRFRPAARIGMAWGLGHTVTIFIVGGAIALLRWTVTPRIGLSMEFTVAVMLVVLGALNLAPDAHRHAAPSSMRPFFVGVVHGLAGSVAAVLLILPLIDDPAWALAYLVAFGAGTIAGMTAVTAAIAAPCGDLKEAPDGYFDG